MQAYSFIRDIRGADNFHLSSFSAVIVVSINKQIIPSRLRAHMTIVNKKIVLTKKYRSTVSKWLPPHFFVFKVGGDDGNKISVYMQIRVAKTKVLLNLHKYYICKQIS